MAGMSMALLATLAAALGALLGLLLTGLLLTDLTAAAQTWG